MLLYHFTSRNTLSAILRDGLLYGRVPVARDRALNAIWLTSDPGPDGHGLSQGGRVMTEDERAQAKEWSGVLPPPGTRHAKEASVRITVQLSETDRSLHPWLPWARRNLPPDLLAEILRRARVCGRPRPGGSIRRRSCRATSSRSILSTVKTPAPPRRPAAGSAAQARHVVT